MRPPLFAIVAFLVLALSGSAKTLYVPDDYPAIQAEAKAAYRSCTEFSEEISDADHAHVEQSFGRLPLYFIENRGQMNEEVAYYVKGSDKTLYFTPEGITFALTGKENNEGKRWVAYEKAISSTEESLERKLRIAESYGDENPQKYLEFLDKYSAKNKNDSAIRFLVNASVNEHICHMRHLTAYFAFRSNKQKALEEMARIAADENEKFFRRYYAVNVIGFSEDGKSRTISTLLKLLRDKDYFIATEAARALEKTVPFADRKEKLEARREMYDVLVHIKKDESTLDNIPYHYDRFLRLFLTWATRDLFGEGWLRKQLKKEKTEDAKKIIGFLNRTYMSNGLGKRYPMELPWRFNKNKGLKNIYSIWKKNGKSGIKIQGDKDVKKIVEEKLLLLDKRCRKAFHLVRIFGNNIVILSSYGNITTPALALPWENRIAILKNNLEKSRLHTGIIPHETTHLYIYQAGEPSGQHRGECRAIGQDCALAYKLEGFIVWRPDPRKWKYGISVSIVEDKHWERL